MEGGALQPGKRLQSAFDSAYHKTVLDVRVQASLCRYCRKVAKDLLEHSDTAFGAGWTVGEDLGK